jgi:SAM-dependent methyltransferase
MPSPSVTESNVAPVYRLLTETTGWRKCIITPGRSAAAFVPWDKLVAHPVRLARGTAVKVVTRSGRDEHTATLDGARWAERLSDALEVGPCHLNVVANDVDWHARRTREGRWLVSKSRPSLPAAAPAEPPAHDRVHQHALDVDDPAVRRLFAALGLYSPGGAPLGEMAGKVQQVQHFIELLRPLPVWNRGGNVRVVDAGCGKAYLSLALALWAKSNGRVVELDAVDSSADAVATVARTAAAAEVGDVRTHAQSIADFAAAASEKVDLLVSLHACDTATDEGLAAGVLLDAGAIVLVPCCHQEISDQMEAAVKSGSATATDGWQAVIRHGLLQHRLADIITDSLRAAALEAAGYRVAVIEFVSPEATARNVMIRAEKRARRDERAEENALKRYRALARQWQLAPALERLLGERWRG